MLSRVRRHSAILLSFALAQCTPIRDVHSGGNVGSAGEQASTKQDAGPTPAVAAPKANTGTGCSQDLARTCDATARATPLLCMGGQWLAQTPCAADERCETATGANLGMCVAIDPGCAAHPDGDEYCDGNVLRACTNMVPNKGRPCLARQRCAIDSTTGIAQCVCAGGAIDQGMGCQVATDCMVEEGGCDPLTKCSVSAGQRICSACPSGFTGQGASGCVPQLLGLTVSGGVLSPLFAQGVHQYKVQMGLLQETLTLTPLAPDGAKITVDGMAPQDGGVWRTQVLTTGAHTIRVSLTTIFGVHSDYDLTVERSGVQEAYLKASRPDSDDQFGWTAAIDGDTLVVGAINESSNAGGVNGNQADNSVTKSGAAYVFVRTAAGWTQQAYLKSDNPTAYDYFGYTVAVLGDMIVVGASGAASTGATPPHNGSVHVFVRDNGSWRPSMRLNPPSGGNAQDMFGGCVALEPNRLAIGSPMESSGQEYSGAVYVYPRSGETFGAPQKIKASMPAASGLFGWSIAFDGDSLAIGAPQYDPIRPTRNAPGSAFVFTQQGDNWVEQQLMPAPAPELEATFGWSVSVWGDSVVVGAPRARASTGTSPNGEAYVFERSGGMWKPTQVLKAPVPRRSDFYGWSVKLSETSLAIGATGDASASRGTMGDPSDDQALYSGALYLLGRQSGSWQSSAFVKASNGDSGDAFGNVVGFAGDTLLSAAPLEGSSGQGVNGDQNNNSLASSGALYIFR
jgi:FG-GAP repeat